MSKSAIYVANSSVQNVPVDGIINLGTVIRRFGPNVALSGNAIQISGQGYYNIEINVTAADQTGPTCTFGSFSQDMLIPGGTAEIVLTCTDTESAITKSNLIASDIVLSNNVVNISNIEKRTLTNGYRYTISILASNTEGTTTLTLPAGTIANAAKAGNTLLVSDELTVMI